MNFQELMSRASANNANATKQQGKSGHHHKDSTPGVSSTAVKAFLEKKEQERKKKQADQEAARLARIQARLDQNLKSGQTKKAKGDDAPKSSFLNPPYSEEEERKSSQIEQKKKDSVAQQKKDRTTGPGSSSKTSASGSKRKHIDRKSLASHKSTKTNEKWPKEKSGKTSDLAVNGKKVETSNKKKKLRTAPPPPNFKELLAIAEQNKSGLNRAKTKTETSKTRSKRESKDHDRIEDSKVRRRQKDSGERGERKLTAIDERNMRIKNKNNNKEKIEVKTKGKQVEPQRKTVVEPESRKGIQSKSRVLEAGAKSLKRTRESDSLGKNALAHKPQRPSPYNVRPPESHLRMMHKQNGYYPSSRPPYHGGYYDEEEDSDLDGFIDDGDDDETYNAGQTDVSKYIKDIFGYDRRRYAAMDDFDDSAMESSFGQIEREEKRSSKIAKLEDEIDFLKEQAELKRQRDKLKKPKMSKKK